MKEYVYDHWHINLEECPFCGSDPGIHSFGKESWFIRCSNNMCAAEQVVYNSLQQAADHWNHRVYIPNNLEE
jgi:hypothetical protein